MIHALKCSLFFSAEMFLVKMFDATWYRIVLGIVVFGLAISTQASAQDLVEFANGTKLEGNVTAIRKDQKEFDISATIGSRVTKRTYSFADVHAVTLNGTRHILTPLESTETASDTPSMKRTAASAQVVRSRIEIDQIIAEAGRTPPDWFASVAMDHPPSLELNWPLKPTSPGWNNQENVGQYIWDIVNPNPHRWRSGIKLIHNCVSLHSDQPELLYRDMKTLGNMYFNLLQDYPRAAFWLLKAGDKLEANDRVAIAECYWRLGSKPVAMEMLRLPQLPIQAIKLFGDMGETSRAIRLASDSSKSTQAPEAFLLAGDALRQAGQPEKAIAFYQRVLTSEMYRNKDYEARHKARAKESIDAIELFDQLDLSKISTGTYSGTSTGYNGPLTVAVQVQSGRINSLKVTQHEEKQFYSALEDTPRRIIDRQSVQEVDGVSGATITSQAIVNATVRALANAKK